MILIDKYDSVCLNSLLKLCTDTIELGFKFLVSGLSKALNSNDYVEFGIITGISLCTTGLSDLNNVEAFKFLRNESIVDFYGLTDEEVDMLLNRYNLMSMKDDVKAHYNGYMLGDKTMYSIWSITHYLEYRELRNYWEQTGVIFGISDCFKMTLVQFYIEELLIL